MRTFAEISRELPTKFFMNSPLGTLYLSQLGPAEFVVVRHFDRELEPDMIEPYVQLIRAAHDWIASHELSTVIEIELPTEIGHDFVTRRWHIYQYATDSYADDEPNAPEAPEELAAMRAAMRAAMGKARDARGTLIEAILARSLLEPSGKTREGEHGFVVVEPRVRPEEVREWARLAGRVP
jgi:hypothetical protein